MATSQEFHTHTALAEGLRELFRLLEERLALLGPMLVMARTPELQALYAKARSEKKCER